MSAMISFGKGSGVRAVAVNTPSPHDVMNMKGKSGTTRTEGLTMAKTFAAKKTVHAEFIVASNSVAHKADTSDSHSKTSSSSERTRHAGTTAAVSRDAKKNPKELKRGMAELLEAEQTIKQSLDGLVDSMRGLYRMA